MNIGGSFWENRWHIRHYKNDDLDTEWGNVAYGTPHYDARCYPTGHAASQYNQGRLHIIQSYINNGHTSYGFFSKGNTAMTQQCDGSWTGADGNVIRLHQHYAGH